MNHVVLTDTIEEELGFDDSLAFEACGSSEKAAVV
jgi:hypothetical protein